MTTDIELRKLAEFELPVAACWSVESNKKGRPLFGKGWMFSPVQQLDAKFPLYTADQMRQAYAQGVASMADRLEKAEKDAARMDWLDNCAHMATWLDFEPMKLVIDAESGDEFTGDTWREAIDTAMESK